VLEKFDRENEFNTELKEYRERHGKATAADKAQPATPARVLVRVEATCCPSEAKLLSPRKRSRRKAC